MPSAMPALSEVTRDEFFAVLYADPRDIMPNVEREEYSDWRVQSNRALFGRSFPGWKNPGGQKSYWLWAARDARDARDAFVTASAAKLLELLAGAPVPELVEGP